MITRANKEIKSLPPALTPLVFLLFSMTCDKALLTALTISTMLFARLTVSLPAVAPDGQGGDGIAGDSGGGRRDLHLDTPSALFVVALQRGAVQRGLDGVAHLWPNRSTPQTRYRNRQLPSVIQLFVCLGTLLFALFRPGIICLRGPVGSERSQSK